MTIPELISTMDIDRLMRYRENLEFYREGFKERVPLNYARVFVEKITSYLMTGMSFEFEPFEDTEEGWRRARRAEEVIKTVYEDNNLYELDFETELDTAVLGDGCYKVFWDGERIRVTSPDVQGIFVWWRGDDLRDVWRVASRYRLKKEEASKLYGVSEDVEVVEIWTRDVFELWVGRTLYERLENPYGFIPFIIFPNLRDPKSFWGVSDLEGIKGVSRELSRAFSQLSRILELSGNPIAVLENVDEAYGIRVEPGAVWTLPEDARAYLLDLLQGGGVRLHIDYIELLYRALHDLSEAPRVAFGENPRSLSGVALEMELHPLLQKVRRKRLIRTGVYRRRNEMILRIWERVKGEELGRLKQRIIWGPILPQDRGRIVRDEKILVDAGIHSLRRAMEEVGVDDPEREFERWLWERKKIREVIRDGGES